MSSSRTMSRYAVYGDSYVTRLEDFCQPDGLGLLGECRFIGDPNVTIKRYYQPAFTRLLQYNADYVFVNLGGDDIDDNTDVNMVVGRLLDIHQTLKKNGAKRVLIASIIERGEVTGTTPEMFNKIRKGINKKLFKTLKYEFVHVMNRVKFPHHYDADLVHPGAKEGGMRNFKYLVHGCLASATYNST